MNSYKAQRRAKDDYFRTSAQSPLDAEDRKTFTRLRYFAPDPAYVVTASVARFTEMDHIKMQSSTGRMLDYMRWGKVQFTIEGLPSAELVLYYNGNNLFLPFRDATSGETTYGAGRYLDPELPTGNTLQLDFNLAYNPYCAYSDRWTCPVPPFENWLQIPIAAGEKTLK